jgi:8-amino-7-oxononanoate synthase
MRTLSAELDRRKAASLYRSRRILDSPQGPVVYIDGQRFVSFCSNDYLGLANHPKVIAAFKAGADRYGVGSGASHLVSGHSLPHHALEEALAQFTGRPRALLFSTGYMANLGVVSALTQRGDTVFEDRLNHASLIDAGLLAFAKTTRYHHGDSAVLADLLATTPGHKLAVTDGVFSMDGDLAPLPELAHCCQQQDAALMVDDAHGLGILGKSGRGTLEHFNLSVNEVPILVGTLGKALGTFGAFVAGSDELIETLIQTARTYIYTTALPPAVAQATLTSLKLVDEEKWRRDHLHDLIRRFRSGARQLNLTLPDVMTPIQPLIVGESDQALKLSDALAGRGILISAIRPPTVPEGSARLRITLSAAHSEQDVDHLLQVLGEVL